MKKTIYSLLLILFVGCKKAKHNQLNVLEASYTVPGIDAAKVETFLQNKFNMSPLLFICCGWEPIAKNNRLRRYGTFPDKNFYGVDIKMASGETIYSNRRDWHKIDTFSVSVVKFLDEP